jgi:SAM-dependent methyltransferase
VSPDTPDLWKPYFKAVANRPAHATAERAMHEFGDATKDKWVLDLGSGSGRDALHFLARGFRVKAVDALPAALAELKSRAEQEGTAEQLACLSQRFEMLELEPESFEIINASMALPFCEPARFRDVWGKIRAALRPGGIFAGHFFGNRDDWHQGEMTLHVQTDVEALLLGMETLEFSEHEVDRETPTGEMRHWHYFEIVARKP